MIPLELVESAEPVSPTRERGIAPASLARASGSKFWRSLEEYADTPEFRAFMEREYPQHIHELGDPISRRRFFALMGASLALAGLNGCNMRQTPEKLVPYV